MINYDQTYESESSADSDHDKTPVNLMAFDLDEAEDLALFVSDDLSVDLDTYDIIPEDDCEDDFLLFEFELDNVSASQDEDEDEDEDDEAAFFDPLPPSLKEKPRSVDYKVSQNISRENYALRFARLLASEYFPGDLAAATRFFHGALEESAKTKLSYQYFVKLCEEGAALHELMLVHEVRSEWSPFLDLSRPIRISWVLGLELVRRFQGTPDLAEVTEALDGILDVWSQCTFPDSLRSFLKFLQCCVDFCPEDADLRDWVQTELAFELAPYQKHVPNYRDTLKILSDY